MIQITNIYEVMLYTDTEYKSGIYVFLSALLICTY